MANSNQLKVYRDAIKRFNEEVDEGIKHLIGTTKLVDPYDIEEGKLTPEEAQDILDKNHFQLFTIRDQHHPQQITLILYEKDEMKAGVIVALDLKTLNVSRKMGLTDDKDLSDHAKLFIKAMKN